MLARTSLRDDMRAVPEVVQGVGSISRSLALNVVSFSSREGGIEISLTSDYAARIPERTRMFARYLSMMLGAGVSAVVRDIAISVARVPVNVTIESWCGQLNRVLGDETRRLFAVNRVLAAAQCLIEDEGSARIQSAVRALGFHGAVLDVQHEGICLNLDVSEGVFGEERFCQLLQFLGADVRTRYVVRLRASEELHVSAARSLGGALVPCSFSSDLSRVGVCHLQGDIDSVDFFSRTGVSPHVMGQSISRHGCLRGLLQATILPWRSQIKNWWIVDRTFFLVLRPGCSEIENLSALRSGLEVNGYELRVQCHEGGESAFVISPLGSRFFVEYESWGRVLTTQVKEHTGLSSQLWLPDGLEDGGPRLVVNVPPGRASVVFGRAVSTIAEGLVPYPIAIQCSSAGRFGRSEIAISPKLICMGASAGVFIHCVEQGHGRCNVKMSLIESDSVSVSRIFGNGVIDNSVILARGLVIEEQVVSSRDIGRDEHLDRVLRIASQLETRGLESQCVVIGRIKGGYYRVYMPGISGMGIVFSESHLTCGVRRCRVVGVHKVLKCPVVRLT